MKPGSSLILQKWPEPAIPWFWYFFLKHLEPVVLRFWRFKRRSQWGRNYENQIPSQHWSGPMADLATVVSLIDPLISHVQLLLAAVLPPLHVTELKWTRGMGTWVPLGQTPSTFASSSSSSSCNKNLTLPEKSVTPSLQPKNFVVSFPNSYIGNPTLCA
jgi:hypothetical protein